jgi:phosphate-selective porin OprO and OprP
MKNSSTRTMTAKRIAVAVAAVCATMSAPSFAAGTDVKALMDLLLKKGVITQQEYDQNIQAAVENEEFKEKRLASDVNKLNKIADKNKDTGSVMKNGIGIQSPDGANTMQLTGRLHMDARHFSATQVGTDPYQDVLQVRRARLGIKGQFQKDFKYEIVGNYGATSNGMSSSTTEVDVAYVDYAANPAASVRFGKFKMPFSLEQLTSSNNIDFMERSLIGQNETEFIPAKETGVMLFGSPLSGLTYAVAASSGRANKSALQDGADLVARTSANLSKLISNSDSTITHVGLAYSEGTLIAMSPASATNEGRINSAFFQSSSALTGPVDRKRLGYEMAFVYDALKVQGEMFKFDYKGANRTDVIEGNYVQAVYNLTGEGHNYSNSSGTFGWIKPKAAFGAGGIGAFQFGLRYSKLDASGVTVSAGKTNIADAMTFGVTWFLNDFSRVMLNYVSTDYNGVQVGTAGSRVTGDKAIMMRGQVSF